MSSAEAQASSGSGLADAVTRLRASPRLALIIGVAVAVAIVAALLLWSRAPNYSVLYSGLAASDGGSVVARLDQMQVPYKLSGGGSTIRVPRSQVDRVRLQLAGDGLPKGGDVGFELMDNQAFGVSEFAEQVNYHRALEGELARSIETIDEVSDARIQLAMPKSTIFVRERQKPKASVVVDLYHGRALADGQVSAIQHLVASAVPGLPVDAVTVVDGRGHLLSADSGGPAGANGSRLSYVAQIEKTYQKNIQRLLAPVVGADNVRAQVVADVDFASREHTRENYSPNDKDQPAAVRSRQSQQTVNKDADKSGVPGALSNQPSPAQRSPINNPRSKKQGKTSDNGARVPSANDASLQFSGALGLNDSDRISTSQSSTTNYELDHVIAHVTDPVGRVTRVSVAVVINQNALGGGTSSGDAPAGKAQANADQAAGGQGTKASHVGLSDARMGQIRNLVRGAIGFSADRGDSVEVMQMPFSAHTGRSAAPAPAWWKNAALQAFALKIFKYLVIALIAWLLWARLVRPLAERSGLSIAATTDNSAPAAFEPNEDSEDDLMAQQTRARRRKENDNLLRTTRQAAQDDPRMVAMIVKGWMKKDG